MAACARFLVRSVSRIAQSAAPNALLLCSGPVAQPGWAAVPTLSAAQCLQARWASSSSAGPTLNPLDQVAIPEPPSAETRAASSKRKRDPRYKFQEKGAFGENVYTKGFSENLHISPYKLNDFVKVLRGLSIQDAIIQCQVSIKKSARLCEEAIVQCRKKAVEQNGADPDRLRIDEMWVGKGQYLKRNRFHARGRSGVMHKYRSHLTIMMKEEPEVFVRTKIVPMLAERPLRKRSTTQQPA